MQFVLWGFAAIVAVLAVRLRLPAEANPRDALHGDADSASAALDTKLAGMPNGFRYSYLLKAADDESPGLRYSAVDALGDYPSPQTAVVLERAYRDSASIVRERALERLPEIDRERGLRLLLAALRDEDSWVRDAAISQFASNTKRLPSRGVASLRPRISPGHQIPVTAPPAAPKPPRPPLAGRRIVPMLMRVLDDTDAYVPLRAVFLLHDITGQGEMYKTLEGPERKHQVIASWKSWWAKEQAKWPVQPDLADVPPLRPTRADAAPEMQVRDVTGQRLHLSRQRGRVTLLNFWGTWCPPCRQETPDLERLHQDYHGRGLDVVGVAVGEQGEESLRKWCAQHNLTYRQALATSQAQSDFGDIEEVPVSLLIDKRGFIRYRWDGERDYNTFQAAVERLINE